MSTSFHDKYLVESNKCWFNRACLSLSWKFWRYW